MANPVERVLLDESEICARYRISSRVLRKWRKDGHIPPPVSIGGVCRWSLSALQRWEAAGFRPANRSLPDLQAEAARILLHLRSMGIALPPEASTVPQAIVDSATDELTKRMLFRCRRRLEQIEEEVEAIALGLVDLPQDDADSPEDPPPAIPDENGRFHPGAPLTPEQRRGRKASIRKRLGLDKTPKE